MFYYTYKDFKETIRILCLALFCLETYGERGVSWGKSCYSTCEQHRFRRACASAQPRQKLCCSLTKAVDQKKWTCGFAKGPGMRSEILIRWNIQRAFPAGTQRWNNVESALIQRCFNVVCLLGCDATQMVTIRFFSYFSCRNNQTRQMFSSPWLPSEKCPNNSWCYSVSSGKNPAGTQRSNNVDSTFLHKILWILQQNSWSNHAITCCLNMDFELFISQDGPCFVYVTLGDVTLLPWT